MKKLLIASTALTALGFASSAALAADQRAPAPAYAPPAYAPPVSDWTGFYVGGHAGYGWGHDPFTETVLPINGGVPGVQVFNVNPTTITGLSPKGGVYGGQFGYNQQWGNWVGGLEFDISGTDMKDSTASAATGTVTTTTTTTTAIATPPFVVVTTTNLVAPITNSVSRADQFDVLASARARLGTLVWGNTVLYGTGGLAWTRFRSTTNQVQNLFGAAGTTAVQVATLSGTGVGTSFGWVAGVGGETKIYNSNWLFRVEWLHYDFGDQGGFTGTGTTNVPGVASPVTSFTSLTTGHLTADVVRAGLSYQFGGRIY
jgi:outer membrane immunogenic protein